jgi:hypothetical protein
MAINNREPLFRHRQAIAIFCRVFDEVRGRFDFELPGFRLEEEWLSFYIKPADGLQLPAIIQWLKQTFAVRFNRVTGRSGHVWGDRYWSRVLAGCGEKSAGEIKRIVEELSERKARYERYEEELEGKGETQKSLTDEESRLMAANGKMDVCYNVQTAVQTRRTNWSRSLK